MPGQPQVDEKTNEIKAIPELLELLCLKGCVVTIDAMGARKEIAEKIIEKEADYILQVKGNQERLMEDIALYFEKDIFPCRKKGLETEGRYYKEISFDHGRQEIREYYVENRIGWLKENHPEWKGLNWVLDIGFREDESRMRAGNAAENVNVLRHIGTNLLKQEKSCKLGIASKRNVGMIRITSTKYSAD